MSKRPTPNGQAGFTFIEVVASVAILSIMGWISLEALGITSRASRRTMHVSELDQRVHRALTRVLRELQEAQVASLVPAATKPLGTSTLSYRCAEVSPQNTIVWGNYRRLELVADPTDAPDGVDNDRDGLVDEQQLRLVIDAGLPSERTTVIVTDVARLLEGEQANALDDNGNDLIDEPGFSITAQDGVLELRLSLQGRDPDNQLTIRTSETTVCPRN